MKRLILAVTLALATLTTAVAQEKTVTIYGWSGDWDLWFSEWGDKFTDETGIKVQYVSGGGLEMYSRVLAEKDAPKADLLLSSASYLFQANNLGVLGNIAWDGMANAKDVDARFKFDSVGVFGYDIYHIAYNTSVVDVADAPKSWADLADPKWKDRVIQRTPASDLSAWIWMAIAANEGEDKAWETVLAMYENSSTWVSSSGEMVQSLALGEGDLGPASIGHIMLAANQAGAPIASAMPESPVLMLNGLGMIKDGPNAEGAAKFLDFFLGTYVQDFIMNKAGTSIAVNNAVELTNNDLVEIGLGGMTVSEVLEISYLPDWSHWTESVGEDKTRLGELSNEIDKRVKGIKQ
ncbi:ABC-type Fe3+ transport system, periplasmic component [Hoeflea sp. IMCC20628]|uniref:ABC transporter substrate-binding protein n=1 Tax=Hoeflea sp. IMCC20628 TaxID=1620421 RepID=UPI00063AB67A|nr:extracellular solute-binding protein [Hoeflea sp. IMCC20628]AKH99692.1 ABC-type Fe3+ transport system, periplasmic component [Hoeflea sp. IMCC20628]